MNRARTPCPICEEPAERYRPDPKRDEAAYHCDRCGQYLIDGLAETLVPQDNTVERYLLSAAIRQQNQFERVPLLDMEGLYNLLDSASLPETPLEAMDRLLLYIYQQTGRPDENATLTGNDYPIVAGHDEHELSWYLHHLAEEGLIEATGGGNYRLTLLGWRRVGEIQQSARISDQAFVAMWFAADMDDAWTDGFKPALEDTAFRPIRADRVEHSGKIDDFIISEIRRSALVVADFTGQRGGVYFEAGFAMGLGIPVIWSCRTDDVDDLHFDTRQYNHITWTDPPELRQRLVERIEAWYPAARSIPK